MRPQEKERIKVKKNTKERDGRIISIKNFEQQEIKEEIESFWPNSELTELMQLPN